MDEGDIPTRPTGVTRLALDWMLFWFWGAVLCISGLLLAGLLALFGHHLPWPVVVALWRALLVTVVCLVLGTCAFAAVAALMQDRARRRM
jgi:hypothetical protein